jgi:hypothetical protein
MPKLKDPNVWFRNALKVTEDPAASGWLKNALVEAINRDPADAAGDAEVFTLPQISVAVVDRRHALIGVIQQRLIQGSPPMPNDSAI